MRRFIVSCVLALGLATVGLATGCSKEPEAKGDQPVDVTVEANAATKEASSIRFFHARTQAGVVMLDALDDHKQVIASFRITKIPGVRYTDETVPSMVIAIDASTPQGGKLYAEQMSVYPRYSDHTRTELELYAKDDKNVVLRWGYNPVGLPQRFSMMRFTGGSQDGVARLGTIAASPVKAATVTTPMSVDDAFAKWTDDGQLDDVLGDPLFDMLFLAQRDPGWMLAIVKAIDPSADTSKLAPSSEGLHLRSSGGGAGGGGGGGSGDSTDQGTQRDPESEQAGNDDDDDNPDNDGDGTPDDVDADENNPNDPNQPDNPDPDNDPNQPQDPEEQKPEDNTDEQKTPEEQKQDDEKKDEKDPKGKSGGGGGGKGTTPKKPSSKGGGSGGGKPSGGGSGSAPKPPSSSSKPPAGKAGQVGSCDPASLEKFLESALNDPKGAGEGFQACSQCADGMPPAAGTGTGTGGGAKQRPNKPLDTKGAMHLRSGTVLVSNPPALGKDAVCAACAKFLSKSGLSHAMSCLVGSSTNGATGSLTTQSVGTKTFSGRAWGVAPKANLCMTGVKRCSWNLRDRDRWAGTAEMCAPDKDGAQVCTVVGR